LCGKKKGIIQGYEDGTFKPTQNIIFAEGAKIISEVYGDGFTTTNPWYKTYFVWLDKKNAIPLTLFSEAKAITRGEMAEITWRVDSNKTDKPSMVYKNNRLLNISSDDNSSISSEQRLLYIKICHERSAYQSFEDCIIQMISQQK
jgi:hypothetical protein